MFFLAILASTVLNQSIASAETTVRHGREPVVRYQARVEDGYLIIKAVHAAGWHTYAMDNEQRAHEALQGKKSLGIEKGTEISVIQGVELAGNWLQTKPIDLSQPELRWFTFGFERTSFFACPVKTTSTDSATLRIRGQACNGETCCNVDVTLALKSEVDNERPAHIGGIPTNQLLKNLVPVQTSEAVEASGEVEAKEAPTSEASPD